MKTIQFIILSLLVTQFLSAQIAEIDYLGQVPPGDNPVEFAPGIITGYNHGFISVSPGGDEIYWDDDHQVVFSKKENGIWTEPITASNINGESVAFSPDGKRLYFTSTQEGGVGGTDAWYFEKTDSGWSNPINAGEPYNSTNYDPLPLFTNNGYAYSTGYAVQEGSKTELVRYTYSIGQFTDPISTNTYPEFGPYWTLCISPDNDYLIFASELGDNVDLYICFINNEGQWSNPKNMGNIINTSNWERFPSISPDGKYLFFIREYRSNNTTKAIWVSTSIIDGLKPKVQNIKHTNSEKLKVYPNPAQNTLQIKHPGLLQKVTYYKIIDLNGKTIQQGKLRGNLIDVSKLNKGIYFLNLNIGSEKINKKIAIN